MSQPFEVVNVMAASLDGRIASFPGESDRERRALGFTNADDREHLKQLLITADAVVVGSSSLTASGSAWVLKNHRDTYPIWVVLTQAGLAPEHKFYTQAELPRWLVSPRALALPPAASGVRNVVAGGRSTAAAAVAELKAAGASRVLLFGGGEINRAFYSEGLVDKLILTLCPVIIASSAAVPLVAPSLPEPAKLILVASQPKGSLVFLTYNVMKS